MNFPDWATPSELRMLYSEARTLGADDLTLSDIDAVKGFLRAKSGGNCPDHRSTLIFSHIKSSVYSLHFSITRIFSK